MFNDTERENGIDHTDQLNIAQKELQESADSREQQTRGSNSGRGEGRLVRTTGQAYLFCQGLVDTQLQNALIEHPGPNKAIKGDGAARLAILLLLSDRQRRKLFLSVANNMSAWPRLRSLFGAPPYNFLLPQDAGALRAGGFAKARANMTYDGARAANTAQFGPGQFEDQHTREYRVIPRDDNEFTPIGSTFFDSDVQLVLQVKVKKRSRTEKSGLVKSILKQQTFFPQPGETVVLKETKSMLIAMGARVPTQTALKVRALYPRGDGCSTATITVVR